MSRSHIIQTQVLEVDFPSKQDAITGQQRLEMMYMQRILPAINSVFDDLPILDNTSIQLDKLELDIGECQLSDFEHDLPGRIADKLRDEVYKLLSKQRNGINKTSDSRTPTRDGPRNRPTEHPPDGFSNLDAFLFFVQNGRFPWWTASHDFKKLTNQIWEETPDLLLKQFRELFVSAPVSSRKRLIYQLPDDVLFKILNAYSKPAQYVANAKSGIRELVKMHQTSRLTNDNTAELRRLLWETAFDQVLFYSTINIENQSGLRRLNVQTSNKSRPSLPLLTALLLVVFRRSSRTPSNKTVGKREVKNFTRFLDKMYSELTKTSPGTSPLTEVINILRSSPPSAVANMIKNNVPDTGLKQAPGLPTDAQAKARPIRNQTPLEDGESIEISNAGLVILAQFLPFFFKTLGLVADKEFVSEYAAERGAMLSQFLVTGELMMPEETLALNKILNGLEIDHPLPGILEMRKNERNEANHLLETVISHWSALKGTSVRGLRQTFLNRPGMLKKDPNGWNIYIERTTVDVLIDHLPWSLAIIKMPWNNDLIYVEW